MSSQKAKTLMVQGTASSVGKSVLVAALCRIFRQDGYKVAPFKSQNMALNSFVTKEGGEIGRAQAVQAEAAGVEPSVDMNPVLLKPEADHRSQVVVLGKVYKNLPAREYYEHTPRLLSVIEGSLNRLRSKYDIVVIEGAGSPAEINLREREIVNMRVAKMAEALVLLVGDIDRGGVFASLVGTLELLTPDERELVKGLVINKFRGDVTLLTPALDFVEKKTGKPVLGVVPFFKDIKVAQEDSVWLEEDHEVSNTTGLDVAVIGLPHMSNYDDFDPFDQMGCSVRFVADPVQLGNPDLIILPGTKTTVSDLNHIRARGLASAVVRRAREGAPVIGICGGYQMLGRLIHDPLHVESAEAVVEGLGLLDIETTFAATKTTTQVKARVMADRGLLKGLGEVELTGYEIHMGRNSEVENPPASGSSPLLRGTRGGQVSRPGAPFQIVETPEGKAEYPDGAMSGDCLVFGSYIHGLFHNAAFTSALLERLRERKGLSAGATPLFDKEAQYDELAKLVRESLDMKRVYEILQQLGRP
jgi:adenosylcobyric acid synthase